MKTAYYDTTIGTLEMTYEINVLYSLKIINEQIEVNEKSAFTENIYNQISEYLDGIRHSFDISYKAIGTPFQEKVWHILETIPYGETTTYGEIAIKLGNAKLSRAVGNACNKNPLLLIIPCHRVIGKNGKLTGFACGIDVKSKLLNIEQRIKKD